MTTKKEEHEEQTLEGNLRIDVLNQILVQADRGAAGSIRVFIGRQERGVKTGPAFQQGFGPRERLIVSFRLLVGHDNGDPNRIKLGTSCPSDHLYDIEISVFLEATVEILPIPEDLSESRHSGRSGSYELSAFNNNLPENRKDQKKSL